MVNSRSVRLWITITLAAACSFFLLSKIASFVHIFGEHAGEVLTQDDILKAYNAATPGSREPAHVPRIVHRIFHNWTDPENEALPTQWKANKKSCETLDPEWESWLWTPKTSRDFIQEEYPWFTSTYDNYRLPIQRIDSLRYFLLRHYGGIYMDADNGCKTSLEPLRHFSAWVVDGGHGALSNDILGGMPEHPFWILMTESLMEYAWNYPLPYITISYAAGQWYETEIWNKYFSLRTDETDDLPEPVRISTDGRPGAPEPVFFYYTGGGTWDNWDNKMFGWIGENLVFFLVVLVGGLVVISATSLVAAVRLRRYFDRHQRPVQF